MTIDVGAIAGPYLTQLNNTNSYTGPTTVTGGQLDLNAAGGGAIPGDLIVNALNASGAVRNVRDPGRAGRI